MPVLTSASAISLINFSLTLQPNLFQLFQPIGGVRASPLSSARARASNALAHATNEMRRSQRQRRSVAALLILKPSETFTSPTQTLRNYLTAALNAASVTLPRSSICSDERPTSTP